MGAVLTSGQNDCRTGDALMMTLRIGLLESFELVNDRLHIGEFVSFGEKVCEEMCQRRCTKRWAQILESVCPAVVYAIRRVGVDPSLGKFLGRVVAGARQHQCRRLVRPLVIHVGSDRRADRATDQDHALTGHRFVYRFPTCLGHVRYGQTSVSLGRAAVSRDVDGNAAVPARQMRQLKNPARLIHWIGMDKGDHRPLASHTFIIKRSVNVLCHITDTFYICDWFSVILEGAGTDSMRCCDHSQLRYRLEYVGARTMRRPGCQKLSRQSVGLPKQREIPHRALAAVGSQRSLRA